MSVWAPSTLIPDQPRRLANLRIAPELVLGLLRQLDAGRHITFAGLPADAEVVAAAYDLDHRCFVLTLESPGFEELARGAVLPYLDVIATDHGPWEIPDSA